VGQGIKGVFFKKSMRSLLDNGKKEFEIFCLPLIIHNAIVLVYYLILALYHPDPAWALWRRDI
jgi:hypothetical protein